jgi:hypothetical protein
VTERSDQLKLIPEVLHGEVLPADEYDDDQNYYSRYVDERVRSEEWLVWARNLAEILGIQTPSRNWDEDEDIRVPIEKKIEELMNRWKKWETIP